MNIFLYKFDTGIVRLGTEDFPIKTLPDQLIIDLQQELKEGEIVGVISEENNERIIVSRENGLLKAKKLVTYHQK